MKKLLLRAILLLSWHEAFALETHWGFRVGLPWRDDTIFHGVILSVGYRF